MPIPIKLNNDKVLDKNDFVDYSILATYVESSDKKTIVASNKDAELLFNIWLKCEKDEMNNTYKLANNIDNKDVLRLKTNGFISGGIDKISFTRKGQMVITTMALSEPNKFEVKKQRKPYNEILANMNKRGKTGYRIASDARFFNTNTSNNLDLRQIK